MESNLKYGYYTGKKIKLINQFNNISETVRPFLVEQYGDEMAKRIIEDAISEFELLIPKIPFINSFRGRFLSSFLLITAQELAAFKAMSKYGKSPAEVWKVCHHALKIGTAKIPKWKKWLIKKLLFSEITSSIFSKRGCKEIGNFEIEYLSGKGKGYNIGVNYHRCGNLEFVKVHGGEKFAPYICMSDIALSDAMDWGLHRTQTLADGCSYCDFRFIEGKSTCISSKTPEVQAIIDKIRLEESNMQHP